jgi:hypothetical protein
MEFRWVALIALWTILSAPIFGGSSSGVSSREKSVPKVQTARPVSFTPSLGQ